MTRDTGRIVSLLTGLLTFFCLHLLFIVTWDRFFLAAPWPGYEESARLGLVEPWFVNSPRSLWVTRTVFFLVAFAFALGRRPGRWPRATLLWAGAAIALIVTYGTSRMPSLPVGGWGFFIYPFRLLLPIVLGTAIGEFGRRVLVGRHARPTPPQP